MSSQDPITSVPWFSRAHVRCLCNMRIHFRGCCFQDACFLFLEAAGVGITGWWSGDTE
jgi:hypothetical protein